MKYLRRVLKMMNYVFMGIVIVALLGGTSSAMSILKPFSGSSKKIVVPVEKSKAERSVRCKGEAKVNDKGQVISCTEGLYLDEESENIKERKKNAKERFLGWLGNFQGLFFWLVIGSIGASMLGFGGLVGSLWSNLFGTATRALKATVRAISRAKRNGGKYMEELDRAHSADPKVQKKINQLRAETDSK